MVRALSNVNEGEMAKRQAHNFQVVKLAQRTSRLRCNHQSKSAASQVLIPEILRNTPALLYEVFHADAEGAD